MTKTLKFNRFFIFFILFWVTGCLFTDPINEDVNSDFTYSGVFKVNKPVKLKYKHIDKKTPDLILKWRIEALPKYSSMGNYSFLPSEENTERTFIPDVPGVYKISLSVEDKYHARSKTVKNINIENTLPVAVIKSLNGISDFSVYRELYFDGGNSYDVDYAVLKSYKWQIISSPKRFKDKNKTSESKIFSFVPTVKGNYSVKLTVTDINNGKNYTTYSFYVNDEVYPRIIKTYPDNKISPLPLKKGKIYVFRAFFYDNSTLMTEFSYQWKLSVNNSEFFKISKGEFLTFNPSSFGVGDILVLKLLLTDKVGKSEEVKWKVIILE